MAVFYIKINGNNIVLHISIHDVTMNINCIIIIYIFLFFSIFLVILDEGGVALSD